MKHLAISLALVLAASSAAAQSDPYEYLNNLTKPYEAKTNPAVQIAPPATVQTAGPHPTRTPLLTPENTSNSNSLLDGCVIAAVGRLPRVDGLRVTNTSYEFRSSAKKYDFYNVMISADLNGRNGTYQWICRVYDNTSAALIENR